MKVEFFIYNNNLLLNYYLESENKDDLINRLKNGDSRNIKGIYHIEFNNRVEVKNETEEEISFCVGEIVGDYIRLFNEVFGLNHNFYFYKEIKIQDKMFRGAYNVSIIKRIDDIVEDDVYIGGNNDNSLPLNMYMKLINSFPKQSEIYGYVYYRIASILKEYYPKAEKYVSLYDKKIKTIEKTLEKVLSKNKEFEFKDNYQLAVLQFKDLLKHFEYLLQNSKLYSELNWQKEINNILQFIYPKYIIGLQNIKIKGIGKHDKIPDFVLIDSEGYVDVMEIKKPEAKLMSDKPSQRNNYTPSRELSTSVQQIEKYILCLNRWGSVGEEKIKTKIDGYNLKNIRIINPKGYLIIGRSSEEKLNRNQLDDFEIIKRQYRNVAEIITYDDILLRIKNIIESNNKKTKL